MNRPSGGSVGGSIAATAIVVKKSVKRLNNRVEKKLYIFRSSGGEIFVSFVSLFYSLL